MNVLNDKKNVSIAIVTYNNADIIEETLHSVFKRTVGIDFKVFVIDNNSHDNTVSIIKKFFPQVKLLELPNNIGFGAAHNKVAELLDSDYNYHVIINPDIRFNSDALTELYLFMESNKDIALVVPKFLNENGTEQYTPKLQPKLKYMLSGRFSAKSAYFKRLRDEYTFKDKEITEPVDVGFCSGCLMFIRTSVFKAVGGFDERYFLYSEDADLTRMAVKYGRTVYNPSVSVTHLWERGYLKSKKLFFIQIKSMFKYLRKWRGNVKK